MAEPVDAGEDRGIPAHFAPPPASDSPTAVFACFLGSTATGSRSGWNAAVFPS